MSTSLINILVFFSPSKRQSCPVREVQELLSNSYSSNMKEESLHSINPGIREIYNRQPNNVNQFVFAHGDNENGGFLVNDLLTREEWWQNDGKVRTAIFHSCYGGLVLREQSWYAVFEDWVSYNDTLELILSPLKVHENTWKRIFELQLDLLNSTKNGIQIRQELEAIYTNEIINADEDLLKSLLLTYLEALTSKY